MVKKVVVKESFTEASNRANIVQWARVLKTEYETVFINKIPTDVIFFKENETVKTYIINEKIDPGYEMQSYIMYLYKKFNEHTITEFRRVIKPINNYNILKKLLTGVPELEFLSIFADIKKL